MYLDKTPSPLPTFGCPPNSGTRLLQELLCLANLNVKIDDDFGPATAFMVERFNEQIGIASSTVVTPATWDALTRTLNAASVRRSSDLVGIANAWLTLNVKEIGGQNRGPWVRAVMQGSEGEDKPWCAGLVSTLNELAGNPFKFDYTWSCTDLYNQAAKKARVFSSPARGDIMLIQDPSSPGYFVHCGVVLKVVAGVKGGVILVAEGNSNLEGSHNGVQLVMSARNPTGKKFLRP